MRDPHTQLYQREYAQVIARTILRSRLGDSLAAITTIRAFELSPVPRHVMLDLATAIGVLLDTDRISYRYDDAAIGAFFPAVESEDELHRKLASAIEAARRSLRGSSGREEGYLADVVLVAESVFAPAERLRATEAADQERRACELRDPREGDQVGWPVTQDAEPADGERGTDPFRSLCDAAELEGEELRSYALIASSMLGMESPLQTINSALRGIGLHYRAHRAYLAMVTFADDVLTVPCEWDDSDTTSIKSRISNSPITRFPFIERNLDARRPVYVSRPRAFSHPGATGAASDPWRYCTVPVTRTDDLALLLCIDGPSANLESWRLAAVVGARILHAWKLFTYSARQGEGSVDGGFADMPGGRELEEIVSNAGGGAWSSLGAVVVSIPNVAEQVGEGGLSRVLSVYESVRAVLGKHFDTMPTFRTADAEFTALCPNSSYHAFIQRCAQARTALISAHPHAVQLGSAWSDDLTGSWDVIDEARVIASHDTSTSFDEYPQAGNSNPALDSTLPDFNPFSKSAALGRKFTVFLQPKIDMRTGELVGAEALARSIGEDGRPASPARAISRMEESGEIGALDYFIFDYALSLMSSWGRRGYAVPPLEQLLPLDAPEPDSPRLGPRHHEPLPGRPLAPRRDGGHRAGHRPGKLDAREPRGTLPRPWPARRAR